MMSKFIDIDCLDKEALIDIFNNERSDPIEGVPKTNVGPKFMLSSEDHYWDASNMVRFVREALLWADYVKRECRREDSKIPISAIVTRFSSITGEFTFRMDSFMCTLKELEELDDE